MKKIIYIEVLEEGTKVFRPVPASKIKDNIYKVEGNDIYETHNETWAFIPGTSVVVEEQTLNGERVLMAIKQQE